MKLSTADLRELADLAIVAASEAGQMIAQSRPTQVQHKDVGTSVASQVVTEIDRRSENIIVDVLTASRERFDLGLLTEERDDDGGRLSADYFWCIDPLDGTLPFIEGVAGYAVSIALVTRDGKPVVGVICDPVEGTLFHAISGAGAFRNGRPWLAGPRTGSRGGPRTSSRGGGVLSVLADRSFLTADSHHAVVAGLEKVARDMNLAQVELHATGGAVMNACGVLADPPACYFKFPKPDAGGGSLWDFAGTACLFHELGAVATDMSGDPLDLNRADSTFMNHRGVLFATDEALAEQIRALRPS